MGIVIRKSLATTVFSYLGVVIGYLNLLYFFPKFLSPSQIGLYRLVLDTALLLSPFAQLGIKQGIIKFYPAGKDQKSRQELEFFASLFLLSSLFIFTAVALLLKEEVMTLLFAENKKQLEQFYNLLLGLIIILGFFGLFEGLAKANISLVLFNFLNDVFIRILTTLSIFLYFREVLNFDGLVYSLLIIYATAALILAIHTTLKQRISPKLGLSTLSFQKIKEIIQYNLFMVVNTGSNLVVGKIDSLMISAMLGLAENGIYQIMFYVAVVVEMPKRAVSQVALSLYSKAFASHKLDEVKSLYFKTALNQLIIGLLLYIGIVVNLHNMFAFIPNGEVYEAGMWVVIIAGASKVIDMASGSNGELIIMSNHYRFNVIAITLLAILTVITNYLFIPEFGMNGAAFASFLSMFLFNLLKMGYIWKKYHSQPFNQQTVKVIIIGVMAFAAGFFFPVMENHFLDLFLRSGVVSIVYGLLIYFSKASEEINGFLNSLLKKVTNA